MGNHKTEAASSKLSEQLRGERLYTIHMQRELGATLSSERWLRVVAKLGA